MITPTMVKYPNSGAFTPKQSKARKQRAQQQRLEAGMRRGLTGRALRRFAQFG